MRRVVPSPLAPIAFAVALDGIAFGVLAGAAGFSPVAATAFSAIAATGSGQFAALSVLQAGGGAPAAGLTVLALNARAIPMGVAVAPVLRGAVWRRVLVAQLVFDESWALAQVEPGRWDRRVLLTTGAVVYVSWVAGTAFGTIGAASLGDPQRLGLDAVFPAFFLALLVPLLRPSHAIAAAIGGAGIALALTPILPPGLPIVAAATGCLVGIRR